MFSRNPLLLATALMAFSPPLVDAANGPKPGESTRLPTTIVTAQNEHLFSQARSRLFEVAQRADADAAERQHKLLQELLTTLRARSKKTEPPKAPACDNCSSDRTRIEPCENCVIAAAMTDCENCDSKSRSIAKIVIDRRLSRCWVPCRSLTSCPAKAAECETESLPSALRSSPSRSRPPTER